MLDNFQERQSAFHEAAHCVIGYYFGWTLTPEVGIRIGRSPFCSMRLSVRDTDAREEQQQSLAGWCAEIILSGRSDLHRTDDDLASSIDDVRRMHPDDIEENPSDDFTVMTGLLSENPNADDEEIIMLYRELTKETMTLLEEPHLWAAVNDLVEELLDQEHIGCPDRVKEIIRPHLEQLLPT